MNKEIKKLKKEQAKNRQNLNNLMLAIALIQLEIDQLNFSGKNDD